METIDSKIKEAKSRPSTPENLNHIGDLYLKKGALNVAVDYYYEAVNKLPDAQKEKKLAIYKKIILNSPNDVEAYEGMIQIFSLMGLVVEEKKYLMVLAELYRDRNDIYRVEEIYKRILELDPHNRMVADLLEKMKIAAEEKGSTRSERTPQELTAGMSTGEQVNSDHVADMKQLKDIFKNANIDIEHEEKEEKKEKKKEDEIVFKVRDRADEGLFSATLEEAIEEKERVRIVQTPRTRKVGTPEKTFREALMSYRTPFFAGIAIFLTISIGLALLFLREKPDRDALVARSTPDINTEREWTEDSISLTTADYDISVERLTDEMIIRNQIGSVLGQDAIDDYHFLSVKIKTLSGCFSDEFVSAPHEMIFFIDGKNNMMRTEELQGVNNLKRIFYRSNACGKEFGAVFMKLFVYYKKDRPFKGLSIKGLDREQPVEVVWR